MEKNKYNFYSFFFFCGEKTKKGVEKNKHKFSPPQHALKAEEHNFS